MTTVTDLSDPEHPVEIDLRSPGLAALLAWLWPGAGHFYQRRHAKGILFMVCILSVYFFGFALGEGHVVYASFRRPHFRYPYLLQVGVGLPALPALAQNYAVQRGDGPLFGTDIMAPPEDYSEQYEDTLARWHKRLGHNFELGTLYTMIAGLLNLLAIFDAYGGPAAPHVDRKQPNEDPPRAPPADQGGGT